LYAEQYIRDGEPHFADGRSSAVKHDVYTTEMLLTDEQRIIVRGTGSRILAAHETARRPDMGASAAASPTDEASPNRLPAALVDEYRGSRSVSFAAWERALLVLPGAETRAVTHYWPFPTLLESGAGSRLLDVDGHEYLDLVNNYTSLVHGNGFAPIAEAAAPTLRTGTVFSAIHAAQVALAEALVDRVDSVELVRFTNSGSEASALAARIARRATGRRRIVVANDVAALEHSITEETAAVFMEPFLGAGGVIPATAEFLRAVQDRARAVGAVFVLDEIQSLRNAPRGVQYELGLTPDLTTFAKVIGGGLPIGAVGGAARLLELTSPLRAGRLDHAGTFNGHVTAAVAGLVSLAYLDAPAITVLNTRAEQLAAAIEEVSRAAGTPTTVTRSGSILNVHPGSAPVTTSAEARRSPLFRSSLHLALLLEGLYTTPRGMINLSTVLTDADLEAAVAGYSRAFARLRPHLEEFENEAVDR
jgi:glutamate-1-semialdehyde 2,1-aminomutase